MLLCSHDKLRKERPKKLWTSLQGPPHPTTHYDLHINERQEINIKNELENIRLDKSNNDKKIIGTINHYVENLKCNNYQGGIENWDEISVTGIMNEYPIGTKLTTDRRKNRDFFKPVELMKELVG